jgi:hypothetical protein
MGTVSAIVVLLVVGSRLLGYGQLDRSAPSSGSTQVSSELWGAYQRARLAARAEAEDARLVSASVQWQAASKETMLTGAGDWSFVFYSPASKQTMDVVVSGDVGRVVDQTRVWGAPEIIEDDVVWAGPQDAVSIFMAYGAETFLDGHPGAIVDLHLGGGSQREAVWTAVALDPQDRSLLSLVIDAETNRVLSTSP